ncbi:MAG TPA: DUF4276 family protein [bacterium]|nr:DUF4276 family protein [bacterium]HPN44962.1 DUF4276 family protein [bacterium]
MSRIYIVVEGETEEKFVKQVLQPFYNVRNVFLYPRMITTNRSLGRKGKGGYEKNYGYHKQIRKEIMNSLLDQAAFCTTMLDLYGLPNDFPGMDVRYNNSNEKLAGLEAALQQDIDNRRFIANLVKHEFEGLLFTNVNEINKQFDDKPGPRQELEKIRKAFATPEDINDDVNTAPSKRIIRIFTDYTKALHGPLIAQEIGLQTLRQACPHFNAWLEKLERV